MAGFAVVLVRRAGASTRTTSSHSRSRRPRCLSMVAVVGRFCVLRGAFLGSSLDGFGPRLAPAVASGVPLAWLCRRVPWVRPSSPCLEALVCASVRTASAQGPAASPAACRARSRHQTPEVGRRLSHCATDSTARITLSAQDPARRRRTAEAFQECPLVRVRVLLQPGAHLRRGFPRSVRLSRSSKNSCVGTGGRASASREAAAARVHYRERAQGTGEELLGKFSTIGEDPGRRTSSQVGARRAMRVRREVLAMSVVGRRFAPSVRVQNFAVPSDQLRWLTAIQVTPDLRRPDRLGIELAEDRSRPFRLSGSGTLPPCWMSLPAACLSLAVLIVRTRWTGGCTRREPNRRLAATIPCR